MYEKSIINTIYWCLRRKYETSQTGQRNSWKYKHNTSSHAKKKITVIVSGLTLKYARITAIITERTLRTCQALRTFPNLLLLRTSYCACRFPNFRQILFFMYRDSCKYKKKKLLPPYTPPVLLEIYALHVWCAVCLFRTAGLTYWIRHWF